MAALVDDVTDVLATVLLESAPSASQLIDKYVAAVKAGMPLETAFERYHGDLWAAFVATTAHEIAHRRRG